MKGIFNLSIAVILVFVSTNSVYAGHYKFGEKKKQIPSVTCSTELPLLYSDEFNSFDSEYWSTEENKPVRIKGRGWIQFRHNTITSLDYIDQNLADFRIKLRFNAWRWQSPNFTIQFTTGEELVFSYKKIVIQKRKRLISRKMFAATAWPEIEQTPLVLSFAGGWNTLMIDYNSTTGVVSVDTDNNCEFDHVFDWKPGLQFSHVTASNQKWDLFELYANQAQKMEDTSSSGIPIYQLEWDGVGDGAKGLAVDDSNHVYVSSPSDNSVKKFDENGNLLAEWPGFDNPQGIAIDQDNFIYIADSGTSSIKKYSVDGVLISELPRYGIGYESLSSVQDVAVDNEGIIYVSSFNVWFDGGIIFGSKIFKFASDWTFIGEVIPGINAIITGLDVDSNGNIYLTTTEGIRKYDPAGNFLMDIGSLTGGNDTGEFSSGSHDVFIDDSDRLFATDGGDNNRIQVFDANGEYVYEWGTTGTENAEFMGPARIALNPSGIYILDSGNNRVQKFR